MLTEIEWWGGLLFIWLALCYYWLFGENRDEPKLSIHFITLSASYLFLGAVLAMFFYPLESSLVRKVFLGVFIIAVISNLISAVWPESEAMSEKYAAQDETETKGELIFGLLLFYPPILIVLALGLYKSREFVSFLSFLN